MVVSPDTASPPKATVVFPLASPLSRTRAPFPVVAKNPRCCVVCAIVTRDRPDAIAGDKVRRRERQDKGDGRWNDVKTSLMSSEKESSYEESVPP